MNDKTNDVQTEISRRDVLRLNNEESNKLTRECIDMALIYLMNDKGFEDISITEIVKRAGVSRTAFYRNYKTKDDIIREIGESLIGRIGDIFSIESYDEKPYEWFIAVFREIKKNKDIVRLLINAKLPVKVLFPSGTILETLYPSKTHEDHYIRIAEEAAFYEIIKEWIMTGLTEDEKAMASLCERIVTGENLFAH